MERITNPPRWIISLLGHDFVLNAQTIVMTLIAMAILVGLGLLASRKLSVVPGPLQNSMEMVVESFLNLTRSSLGPESLGYFKLILALFLFILVSNWLGLIPFLSEPTADINTALMMGILGFVVTHAAAIRAKGMKKYLKSYIEPFPLMLPLNLISEVAKVVSISFRLYGNIMGGALILLIVSDLVHQLVLPPFLQLFFGVFTGVVQAFVFAMLTLTYLSFAVKE